jgi:hypothetical protein
VLISRDAIVRAICPPLDAGLVTALVDELVSLERRYIQRDWEPAELDGGQFCEVLARILYHADSGNLSPGRDLKECLKYLRNDAVPHLMSRTDAQHIGKVLESIYKVRSARGAVHISPTYGPNQMDAKLVIECVRWMMAETLRIWWTSDRERVAVAIRELLQFDVPAIGAFEELLVVQRTDLTAEEELLLLLHYAGDAGFTRAELGRHAQRGSSTTTEALQRLASPQRRQIVLLPSNRYRLTDLGAKRVREELSAKLVLQ